MKTYTVTEYEEEDYERARNMGISDVIERLGWIKRGWLPDYSYNHDGTEDDYERFTNQMAMIRAIELLGEYKGLLK